MKAESVKKSIASQWAKRTPKTQVEATQIAVGILAAHPPRRQPRETLTEQPFDSILLTISPLFRKSRNLYLANQGRFEAALVSSPRTLSSPILLEPVIEYSPIERELIWTATDRRERLRSERLIELRTYCSSLYHEQNHRLLWNLLPPCPRSKVGYRKYLNFVESLIIAADMALGDELGHSVAELFYLTGVIYDPGTKARDLCPSSRSYRNYLQAALLTTYLYLEFYSPVEIRKAIRALFPSDPEMTAHASERALRLDSKFVTQTNPNWQTVHRKATLTKVAQLSGAHKAPLELPKNPLENHLQYLWAERWFDLLGI